MIIEFLAYGYIYKLTCLVNDKIYFGQTLNYDRRRNEYSHREGKDHKSYNTPIMRAINKYTFKNFKMELIDFARDQEELDILESHYIITNHSTDPTIGYNSRTGSLKTKLNSVSRKKMSESHKGLIETAITKRKKSKTIIAFKDGQWLIGESGKLFADHIGSSKDMVARAIRHNMKIRGWYVFREDSFYNLEKYKNLRDNKYLELAIILKEGVETIESAEDTLYLKYE